MIEELLAEAATDSAAAAAGADEFGCLPGLVEALDVAGLDDRELVTRLAMLEDLTRVAAAAKIEATAALHQQRCTNDEATDGAADGAARVTPRRRGRGVAHEVALARRESPATGARHLTTALALTQHMPHALAALRNGRLSEQQAMMLAEEVGDLAPGARGVVDEEMADHYGPLSTKDLRIRVRTEAARADPTGAAERARRARGRRQVTCRSTGDGMARITGHVPATDAITAMDSLREHAEAYRRMGDERTRDQLVADAFTDRLHQDAFPRRSERQGQGDPPPKRGVEIQLVMNAEMLLGHDTDTPAHVPGYGPVPMPVVADLLADDELAVFIRRLYTHPDLGTVVSMDSRATFFRGSLRRLLFARDGDTCRTPGCNARPRHGDHVTARADGGSTSLDQGQGLCEACNYVKDLPGWRHRVVSRWPDSHRVTITTPTGHTYDSHAPPVPVRVTTTVTGHPAEAYYTDLTLVWEPDSAA